MAETTPVSASKLAYVGVRTHDLDRMLDYYTQVLCLEVVERDSDSAYLTTGPDHHCVALEVGEPHGRARVGLEIHGSLHAAAASLIEQGIEAEHRSDPEPGITEALIVAEPNTEMPIHLFEAQAGSGVAPSLGLAPTKIGHVAGYVPSLSAAQGYYEKALGFRWSDTIGDFFTFLRCNPDHHAINLMESSKRTGLHHTAYEMRDFIHLKQHLDHLAANDYALEWGPGRHGAGHNIFSYHRDPDGNLTEAFTELDVIYDEESEHFEPRPWHEDFPQRPKFWDVAPASANKWGPVNFEMIDH